jgi:uncharacterized membrane protein YgcG
MNRHIPLAALTLTCAWWLLLPDRAAAVAPVIVDGGEFFSADAVKKANEQIRELYRKYDRDLLIETFKTVPAELAEKAKSLSKEERDKLFETWAREQAEARAVNGIYILITREPPRLQVEVSPRFRSVVDGRSKDRLLNMLLNDFRNKNFDAGLDEAVKFMRVKMEDQGLRK